MLGGGDGGRVNAAGRRVVGKGRLHPLHSLRALALWPLALLARRCLGLSLRLLLALPQEDLHARRRTWGVGVRELEFGVWRFEFWG